MPWLLGGVLLMFGAAALFGAATSFGAQGEYAGPLGIGALGLGVLLFGWWFAPVVELEFDRGAGLVRFSEIRLYRRLRREFPLTPQTRVAQQADHNDGARLTRLALRTDEGVVPLERGYGSGDRNAIEAEINGWLSGDVAPPADRTPPGRPTPPKRPRAQREATVRRRR